MRRSCGIRRPISSKSGTCTARMNVYAAGISVKESAFYPGRSAGLPCATAAKRRRDEPAEVSRRHRSSTTTSEGLNLEARMVSGFMTATGDIGGEAEMIRAHAESIGRNPRGQS